nr:retrovirus-related Pol polyprotein from transposon TNT 1-94 [Tanacetum cinerariifolium]
MSKSPRSNNKRAFIGGSLSDSGEDEEEKAKDETCLVAQASNEICLGINLEPEEWIKDSGCSKHMTGNRKLFSTYKSYNGGNVIFGSNLCGNIIGKDYLTKFDPKSYEDVFLGYSQNSKAYIILNKQTMKVKESLNVTFDETSSPPKTSPLEDDDLVEEEDIESAFLNGFINEEVYMAEPPGLIDFAKLNHVYRLKKALYGLRQAPKAWLDGIPIMYDSKGAIDLSKNPVQHSRIKHIEIRLHFLRDNVQKENISIEKVSSEDNIVDILTKPLKREPFNYLRLGLGMMEKID